MKRAGFYVALWGVFIAVLALLQFVFSADELQWALALGVAFAILLIGGLLLWRPSRERLRLLPQNSYATVLLAIGVVMVGLGVLFGMWLYLMGAGVILFAAAGLVREARAAHRSAG